MKKSAFIIFLFLMFTSVLPATLLGQDKPAKEEKKKDKPAKEEKKKEKPAKTKEKKIAPKPAKTKEEKTISALKSDKRVKRIVNRIANVNILMWGIEAQALDHQYQLAKQSPIEAEWRRYPSTNGNRSIQTRNRQWNDPKRYNSSYNTYQYYAQQRAYQVRQFRDLADLATEEDLVELTDHSNGVVRCYAFWALLEQHYPQSFDILLKHLNDDTRVETFGDQDVAFFKVGDFFIEMMEGDKFATDLLDMTNEQVKALKRLLVEDETIKLEARFDLINELEPSKDNYPMIRQTAMKHKDARTIVQMAKYRKEEDKELIKNLFARTNKYYALQAIRHYPDSSFFTQLKEIHALEMVRKKDIKEGDLNMLYQAIVQYKNEDSKKILEESLGIKKKWVRKIHERAIWLALHKYPSAEYNSVKKSLRLDNAEKKRALQNIKY